ncbi:hypothetical protein OC844_005623 [Tilletia horrida]|nr:hypothetical protein OC844_005623 [Tilletia horrida]
MMIRSCQHCQTRKIKCNRVFPCEPCIARGEGDTCAEGPSKRNRGPRTKYASEQTVFQLQAYVQRLEHALHASQTNHFFPSSTLTSTAGPGPSASASASASALVHGLASFPSHALTFATDCNSTAAAAAAAPFIYEPPSKRLRTGSATADNSDGIQGWESLAQEVNLITPALSGDSLGRPSTSASSSSSSGSSSFSSSSSASVSAGPAVEIAANLPVSGAEIACAGGHKSPGHHAALPPFETNFWALGACTTSQPISPPLEPSASVGAGCSQPLPVQMTDVATEQQQQQQLLLLQHHHHHLLGSTASWEVTPAVDNDGSQAKARMLGSGDASYFMDLLPPADIFSILLESFLGATHQVIGHIFHTPSLRQKLDWIQACWTDARARPGLPLDDIALLFAILSLAAAHLDGRHPQNAAALPYLAERPCHPVSSPSPSSLKRKLDQLSSDSSNIVRTTVPSRGPVDTPQVRASRTWAKASLRALELSGCIFHLTLPSLQAVYLLEMQALSTALSPRPSKTTAQQGREGVPERARLEALSSVVVRRMRKMGLHRMRMLEEQAEDDGNRALLAMPWCSSLSSPCASASGAAEDKGERGLSPAAAAVEIEPRIRLEMIRRTFWAFEHVLAHQALAIDGIFTFPIEQIDTDLPWNADDFDLVIKDNNVHTDLSYPRCAYSLRPIMADMSRLFHPACGSLFLQHQHCHQHRTGLDAAKEDYDAVLAIDRKIHDFVAALPHFYQLEDLLEDPLPILEGAYGSSSTPTNHVQETSTSTAAPPPPPPPQQQERQHEPDDTLRLERYLLHQSLAHKLIRLHRAYVRDHRRSAEVASSAALRLLVLQRNVEGLSPTFVHMGFSAVQTITAVLLLVADLAEHRTPPGLVPRIRAEIGAAQDRLDLLGIDHSTLERTRRAVALSLEQQQQQQQQQQAPAPIREDAVSSAPVPASCFTLQGPAPAAMYAHQHSQQQALPLPIPLPLPLPLQTPFNTPRSLFTGELPSANTASSAQSFADFASLLMSSGSGPSTGSTSTVPLSTCSSTTTVPMLSRRSSSTRSAWQILNSDDTDDDADGDREEVGGEDKDGEQHGGSGEAGQVLIMPASSLSTAALGMSCGAASMPSWTSAPAPATKRTNSYADEYRWAADMLDSLLSDRGGLPLSSAPPSSSSGVTSATTSTTAAAAKATTNQGKGKGKGKGGKGGSKKAKIAGEAKEMPKSAPAPALAPAPTSAPSSSSSSSATTPSIFPIPLPHSVPMGPFALPSAPASASASASNNGSTWTTPGSALSRRQSEGGARHVGAMDYFSALLGTGGAGASHHFVPVPPRHVPSVSAASLGGGGTASGSTSAGAGAGVGSLLKA